MSCRSLETTLREVTVFPDQARVVRRGRITLTGAEQVLQVEGLPSTLLPQSLRVAGEGTLPVKILGIQVDTVYAVVPVADQVAQLTQELNQLLRQQQTLDDRLAVQELQRDFIQRLLERSVDRMSRSLSLQQMGLEEVQQFLTFGEERYCSYTQALLELQQERQEIQEQIQQVQAQLHQLQTARPRQSYTLAVSIAVEPSTAGEFQLELTYSLPETSWTPRYDLRVDLKHTMLTLTYLADVQQRTGEPWQDVLLTVSTAQPGVGSLPPQLDPWYLRVESPMEEGEVAYSFADLEAVFSREQLPIPSEGVAATAAVEGGVVTFTLERPCTVPSDQDPHQVTVYRTDLPCQLEYLAIPKRVSFAYLRATLRNPDDGVTLLPGEANIFRDDTFVGTESLHHTSPGQEFALNLGIDESLQIRRDLVERQVDKRLISGQRRITFAYRIEVINLRQDDLHLILLEQIPVSQSERIKVRFTRSEPPIEPSKLGRLEWRLTLRPKGKQVITYQFTVEAPPDLVILGLEGE